MTVELGYSESVSRATADNCLGVYGRVVHVFTVPLSLSLFSLSLTLSFSSLISGTETGTAYGSCAGHIVVTNFPLCALNVLWSIVEFL